MDNAAVSVKDISKKEQINTVIICILLLLVSLPFANTFENFWLNFIGLPSAKIASLFLASDLSAADRGFVINNEKLPIYVTKACSAANFFILIVVFLGAAVIKSCKFEDFSKIIWIIPLAYCITVFANVSRIVGCWFTGRLARNIFPENFWPAVHLGTGVIIFLTFLIGTYLILKWRLLHDCYRNRISACYKN
jgi:exosortase K